MLQTVLDSVTVFEQNHCEAVKSRVPAVNTFCRWNLSRSCFWFRLEKEHVKALRTNTLHADTSG